MCRPATKSMSHSSASAPRACASCCTSCGSPTYRASRSAIATSRAADYPQWSDHEFCNSVRKLLGVSSGWDWLSPDQPIRLSHSLAVTGGVAGREPCQKIVDGYYGTQQRSGQYTGCAAYTDFRELLEKQKDLDAVVVCTTDNLHAAVSAAAMRKAQACLLPEAADAHHL